MLKNTLAELRLRFGVRRAPFVLISYPKSGRTWLRLMLGKALRDHFDLKLAKQGDLLSIQKFTKIDRRIPRLELSHDGSPFLQTEAARPYSPRTS